jgi:serine/threonine-protein kinase RsbW
MSAQKTYRLTIKSETDQLTDVRQFVSDRAREHGFVDDDVNKIAIAVDEACTNIIKHGYNFSPDHAIDIEIRRDAGNFEITIADTGKRFDPKSIATPDMKEYLSHYRRGGLGVYLMKRIMDTVEFDTRADRNILRMVKTLQ